MFLLFPQGSKGKELILNSQVLFCNCARYYPKNPPFSSGNWSRLAVKNPGVDAQFEVTRPNVSARLMSPLHASLLYRFLNCWPRGAPCPPVDSLA